jgi:hypothetical protein
MSRSGVFPTIAHSIQGSSTCWPSEAWWDREELEDSRAGFEGSDDLRSERIASRGRSARGH